MTVYTNKQRITTTNKTGSKNNRGGNRTELKSKRTDTMVSFFYTMLIEILTND